MDYITHPMKWMCVAKSSMAVVIPQHQGSIQTPPMTLDDVSFWSKGLTYFVLAFAFERQMLEKTLPKHLPFSLLNTNYYNPQGNSQMQSQDQLANFESQHGTPYPQRKRFCCRAIKRLKEKCLTFHDNNQDLCQDVISGYAQCRVVKQAYEAKWNQMFGRKEVV